MLSKTQELTDQAMKQKEMLPTFGHALLTWSRTSIHQTSGMAVQCAAHDAWSLPVSSSLAKSSAAC